MSVGTGKTQVEASPIGNAIKASLAPFKGWRVGNGGGGLFNTGLGVTPATTSGTAQTNAVATATESDTIQLKTVAAGSTTFAGVNESSGTNDGVPLRRIVSCSHRVQSDQNLLVRYWIGMYKNRNLVANDWSTETPNLAFIGFHFSTTVLGQNTWQAVCINDAGTLITSINTGVLVDTSQSTLFQWTVGPNMGSINFFINGVQVATIVTNIPTATPMLLGEFVDNTNQANIRSLTMQWAAVMLQ